LVKVSGNESLTAADFRANAMERQSPVAAVGVSAARTTGANASSAPSATPHYLKDQQQVAAASYQQHVNPAYSGAESANGPNGVSYGYPAQVPSSFNMGPMGGMSAADYNSAYGSDAQRMMVSFFLQLCRNVAGKQQADYG
jgi:hypothetical protein